MIPRLSLLVASPCSVASIAPLVRERRACAAASSPRAPKPEMSLKKRGQNAAASAAAGDGNNADGDQTPPATSTFSSSAAAAIAAAASLTVDEFIRSGDIVAVGPGELPAAVLSELAKRLESKTIERVRVVAAGDAPAAEAAVAGVPQVQRNENATPDVAILQADEVDRGDLSFVSCRHDDGLASSSSLSAGALPQPQLARVAAAASAARRGSVALATSPLCLVDRLTGDVPVAVELGGMKADDGNDDDEAATRDWEEAAEELDDEFLGDASLGVWRRPSASGSPRTHPRGGDNPHAEVTVEKGGGITLLDVRFGEGLPLSLLGDPEAAYEDVLLAIEGVEGVVGCGLFCRGVAGVVIVAGAEDGRSPVVMRRQET